MYVRIGMNTSSSLALKPGIPQGYVLVVLLVHTGLFGSNSIIKFADDTNAEGLITNSD